MTTENARLIRETAEGIKARRDRYRRAVRWSQASIAASVVAGVLFFAGAVLHDFNAPALAFCSWAATAGAFIVSVACIFEAKR